MHYIIQPNTLQPHCLDINLFLPHTLFHGKTGLHLYMPRYIQGSYMMRDFAKHIINIQAKQNNVHIDLIKKGIDCWYIEIPTENIDNNNDICIQYTLWCNDLSVRANYVDDARIFINGAATFLYAKEYMHAAVTLDIKNIDFTHQIFTTLQQIKPLQFNAESYDELTDHPILIINTNLNKNINTNINTPIHITYLSNQINQSAQNNQPKQNIPKYALVLHGDILSNTNIEKISEDIQKICTTQDAFFDCVDEKKAKYCEYNYLFMAHVMQNGYGGLEHRASTALACSSEHLNTDISKKSSKYLEFLGLCSHEYFHSWWVKRVKPQAFIDVDMQCESDTSLLWLFEGFTSYYDDLFLHRAGIIDKEQYIELLQKNINLVYAHTGHYHQSLHDASVDAWIKYYQPHSNSHNNYVSYYSKGALLALCLDLHLRIHSQHAFSLDDVMRFIFNNYGRNFFEQFSVQNNTQNGLTYAKFVQSIQVCTGIDVKLELNQWIMHNDTQHKMPFIDYLQHFGVFCKQETSYEADWGIQYKQSNEAILIEKVHYNGLAYKAKLMSGDILLAVNDIMLLPQKPNEIFERILFSYNNLENVDFLKQSSRQHNQKSYAYSNLKQDYVEILYVRNRQIKRVMLKYEGMKKEKIILKIEKYINFNNKNQWLS